MSENKETLKDKFRSLWTSRGSSPKSPPANLSKNSVICDEFWLDISASQPIEVRIEKLKDVTKVVENQILDDAVMKRLWLETKDLLQPEMRQEMRLMELRFIQSIIKGQYQRLGIMRAVFFQALEKHSIVEDLPEVVKTFESLTDNGKDAEHFEQELGSCLIEWLSKMKGSATLLLLLINIIKFNSSCLDQDKIMMMLKFVSNLCKSNCEETERKLGLQVVDAVICYSSLPHGSLNSITIMLCYTLNMKKFCSQSWKLMRKLLGTHLGHSCISIMCSLLQNPKFLPQWPVLRSAVFYIGMGLWGSVRVKTLKRTPQSVLPSFNRALLTKNEELALEVALTIQRLVRKYGHELQSGTWDHILNIVTSLLGVMDESLQKKNPSVSASLQTATHEILTFIEKLVESELYDGSVDRLFAITERCRASRSTESVFLLISYKLRAINPSKQNWIPNILLLVETFYIKESRSEIRLKVIEVLSSVIAESMDLYEEELVNEVLVISFENVAKEKNLNVKTSCLELLFQACLLSNSEVPSLLRLIESALPINWMEKKCVVDSEKDDSKQFLDVEVLINGLIDVFKQKMYRCPGSNAVICYNLFITFLHRIYSDVMVSSITSNPSLMDSRKKVFKTLLSLRANEKGNLFPHEDENSNTLSSLGVMQHHSNKDDTKDCGYLEFQKTLECVLSCLENDKSWSVIDCVLSQLKEILQNKFILTGNFPEPNHDYPCLPYIDKIATVLCAMTADAELTKKKSYNREIAKYDMQAAVISVLSSIICYHRWLDMSRQRQILRCLETGFVSRCARLCVQTVTLCIVEMPHDALLRLLPSILSRLTQMSATVHLSTAVLGLLAVLAQMPGLFMNFVEEQYKSIFAVALQYTDPLKFSRYVVSLAHFVVGAWFAKCRMSFRLDFVGFITRNLKSVNRADTTSGNAKSVEAVRNNLMESCIDMMAQHTFSNGSSMPRRSPLAQFMFENGATATWIVGNKLVTVTTSSTGNLSKMVTTSNAASSKRMVAFEAPAKLSSSAFTPVVSSARQRHKSGGAILKQLSNSPFESTAIGQEVSPATESMAISGNTVEKSACNLQQWLTGGWAEIYVRRPNGNCAWSMRIQNHSDCGNSFAENALSVHSALEEMGIIPKKEFEQEKNSVVNGLETEKFSNILSVEQSAPLKTRPRCHSTPDEPEITDSSTLQNLNDEIFPPTSNTPSPTSSTEPQLRHRSHTLSTSKNCDVETAASAARYKAEQKKYQQVVQFDDSPTQRPASALGMRGSVLQHNHEKGCRVSIDKKNDIISPSYVFLQLFQNAWCTESIHRPILLPRTPAIERSVQVLDRIPPYDTWATGVIYIGPNDGGNGDSILANEGGSPRYQEFLKGLGELVSLQECDPVSTFLGGLDTKGEDGEFTYVWKEDVLQMVFHVTTLMPVRSDLAFKKRHIGNDYVIIAYDDDNGSYVPGCTIQGQFRSAELIITPLDKQTNHVRYVFHKEPVEKAVGSDAGPWLISDKHLSVFVRQLALHACMAAYVCVGEGANADEYSSKALARLKQIKRIRTRAMQELDRDVPATTKSKESKPRLTKREESMKLEEFSDYVR